MSIDAWTPMLRPLAPRNPRISTLPIPSTIPFVDDPERVAALRGRLAEGGRRPVFVHFGTYGGLIAPMLRAVLPALIRERPDARILLLGAGGAGFADRLRGEDRRMDGVLVAPGFQSAEDVSLHLQASDVALQPYPDGADTRRTSLIACLANGVPTVTTRGRFTDAAWRDAPLAMAPAADPSRMAALAAEAARHPAGRGAGAEAVRAFYGARFGVERTVQQLLAEEGGG